MDYFTLKALHLIGMVSWFAGLFYIPRLFIYDVEAGDRPDAVRDGMRDQLRIMQRRLWYIITWPAMIFTTVFGAWMLLRLWQTSGTLPGWMHVKLTLIVVLMLYHLQCGRIRKQLAAGTFTWSSPRLRMWNEVATLLLVAIIFLAVKKAALDAVWAAVGLVVLGVVLMILIRVYRKIRQRGSAAQAAVSS